MQKKSQLVFLTIAIVLTVESRASIDTSADQFLRQVKKLLPQVLKDEILPKVKITFASLNNRKVDPPRCHDQKVMTRRDQNLGLYLPSKKTVTIEKQLLKEYFSKTKVTYNCKHGNLKKRALATVIHELFHAYDLQKRNRTIPKECRYYDPVEDQDTYCKRVIENSRRKFEVSDDIIFQNKAFWRKGTVNNKRVPDQYENENIQDFAAVNFEYFILDKEYKCRRPALYKYYSKEFNFTPFSAHKCQSTNQVLIQDKNDLNSLITIDPDRVYQVHYLLASEGNGAMSSFGHSMIRIVMCAPESKNLITGSIIPATPIGPECLKDIDHHVVLTFRASVDDIEISTIKGLKGDYPSNLYVIPFNSIVYEYNKEEIRNLYSFPLNLSKTQIINFVQNTLSTYWGYQGNYKFFTINCATETYQLLASIFDDISPHFKNGLRPYTVLNDLISLGVIDKKYKDFSKLEKYNIFKSNLFYLKHAYRKIFPKVTTVSKETIFSYLKGDPGHRGKILEDLIFATENASRKKRRIALASFLNLEYQALILFRATVYSTLKQALLNKDDDKIIKAYLQTFQHISEVNNGKYGIPQKYEMKQLKDRYLGSKSEQEKTYTIIEEELKPYTDELEIIKTKIDNNTINALEVLTTVLNSNNKETL